MGPLQNSRHERFAQSLVAGMSKQAAYFSAGYKPDRGAASRLSANVSILARVEELQESAAEEAQITVQSLTIELECARKFALEKGQISAAVSASLAKARINGFLGSNPSGAIGTSASDEKPIAQTPELSDREFARRILFIINREKYMSQEDAERELVA